MKKLPNFKSFKDIIKKNKFITKAKKSLKASLRGKEKINNILIWWGGLAYISCFLLINPLIGLAELLDFFLAFAICAYFIFHIILIFKNSPKKPKLTKEEKKKIKAEKKKNALKRFLRKLFLKDPIGKFRPNMVAVALDLLIITHYVEFLIK